MSPETLQPYSFARDAKFSNVRMLLSNHKTVLYGGDHYIITSGVSPVVTNTLFNMAQFRAMPLKDQSRLLVEFQDWANWV